MTIDEKTLDKMEHTAALYGTDHMLSLTRSTGHWLELIALARDGLRYRAQREVIENGALIAVYDQRKPLEQDTPND